MSYQGPMLIREPELRWPVILAALIITALVVLLTAGAISMALATPAARPPVPPPLVGALRPAMPEFDRFRERIIVERLRAAPAPGRSDDSAVEVSATVRNTTDRTLSGLEMKGGIVDARNTVVRERAVQVIPARQAALEPGEAIGVRVVLEGSRLGPEHSGLLMEVTALRVD